MIRAQQHQLDTLRAQQSTPTAVEDTEFFPTVHPAIPPRPIGLSIENSQRSPMLRPRPSEEGWGSPVDSRGSESRRSSFRDETAYYQAEQANLQRENQMLRIRVRELERLVAEKVQGQQSPVQHSNLVTSPPLEAEDA